MRTHIIIAVAAIFVLGGCTVYNTTYTDPLYSSHPDYTAPQPQPRVSQNQQQQRAPQQRAPQQAAPQNGEFQEYNEDYSDSYVNENGTNVTNNYYGDAFVGGSYAQRINRFHRPAMGFSYFSPFYNPGFSFGVGFNSWGGSAFSFGFGNVGFGQPFCDPFWDPFCGAGFYDPFWGPSIYRPSWYWNRFAYNPWGFYNPWRFNNPWGYNDFYGGRAYTRPSVARYGRAPVRNTGTTRGSSRTPGYRNATPPSRGGNSGGTRGTDHGVRRPAGTTLSEGTYKNGDRTPPTTRSSGTNPKPRTPDTYARPTAPTRGSQPGGNNAIPERNYRPNSGNPRNNVSPQPRQRMQQPQRRPQQRGRSVRPPQRRSTPSRSVSPSRSYNRGGSFSRGGSRSTPSRGRSGSGRRPR